MREPSNLERFAGHRTVRVLAAVTNEYYQRYLPVDHIRVADNGSNLRVAIPSLGSFVDVRASNNREAIINNTNLSKMNIMTEIKPMMPYLGMDIDLLCSQYVTL